VPLGYGIHFGFEMTVGQEMGVAVAQKVMAHP